MRGQWTKNDLAPRAAFTDNLLILSRCKAIMWNFLRKKVLSAKAEKPSSRDAQKRAMSEQGILAFSHTGDVIRAESLLKAQSFSISVSAPPPELRTGCDLVIVFTLMEQAGILHALSEQNINPEQVLAKHDTLLEPVSLFHSKDFGEWYMVRAANMKIIIEKTTHRIVNISGGGCPDVPYLAACLTGKCMEDAPEPRTLGQTLCCYSLQLAFEEMQRKIQCGL